MMPFDAEHLGMASHTGERPYPAVENMAQGAPVPVHASNLSDLAIVTDDMVDIQCENGPDLDKSSTDIFSKQDMNSDLEDEMLTVYFQDTTRKYSCQMCSMTFKNSKSLKRHMMKHSDVRPFKCSLCNYAAKERRRLRYHMLVHENIKPYTCPQCDYGCREPYKLKLHLLAHSNTKSHKCNLCSYSCVRKRDLIRHSKCQHLKCELCSYCTVRPSELAHHCRLKHGQGSSGVKVLPDNTNLSKVTSVKPNQRTDTESDLEMESRSSDEMESNDSLFEGLEKSAGKLIFSPHSSSLDEDVLESASMKFKCDLCELCFENSLALKSHWTMHEKERNFTIDISIRALPETSLGTLIKNLSAGELSSVVKDTTLEAPIADDKTDRKCKNGQVVEENPTDKASSRGADSSPEDEMLTVYFEGSTNKFICQLCSEIFRNAKGLKRHMMRHSNVRPYKCSLCNYAAKENKTLKYHMLVHENIKPYKCPQCDYSCREPYKLKLHQLTHSNTRSHKCDICSYSCVRKSDLSRHNKCQHFKCELCLYCTVRPNDLADHCRLKHGQGPCGVKVVLDNACLFKEVSVKLHHLTDVEGILKKKSQAAGERVNVDNLHGGKRGNGKLIPSCHSSTVGDRNFPPKSANMVTLTCDLCGHVCTDSSTQLSHLIGHMKKLIVKVRPLGNMHVPDSKYRNDINFTCDQCGGSCKNWQELECHLACHASEKTLPGDPLIPPSYLTVKNSWNCDLCGLSCKSFTCLRHHLPCHLTEGHFSSDVKSIHKIRFDCDLCGLSCLNLKELQCHLCDHINDKP